MNIDLVVKADVECPKCEHDFNLFEQSEFTDDGYIFDELMPLDGSWGKHGWNKRAKCPKCGELIIIKNVNW